MYYICENSALSIWRGLPPGMAASLEPSRITRLRKTEVSTGILDRLPDYLRHDIVEPLHVFAMGKGQGNGSRRIEVHRWGSHPVPRGSFHCLEPNLLLASPELCLIQLAATSTIERGLMTAAELCGSYRLGPGGIAYYDEPALTSRKDLQRYSASLHAINGKKKLGRIIRWIPQNSASPRESMLYYMLSLPSKAGGFQIEAPEVNYPVRLSPLAGELCGKTSVKCDLFWPKHSLAVEYDSTQFHLNTRRQDMSRREALEVMGIKMVTIGTEDFNDFDRFCVMVSAVREHMGLYKSRSNHRTNARRRDLHRRLRAQLGTES